MILCYDSVHTDQISKEMNDWQRYNARNDVLNRGNATGRDDATGSGRASKQFEIHKNERACAKASYSAIGPLGSFVRATWCRREGGSEKRATSGEVNRPAEL